VIEMPVGVYRFVTRSDPATGWPASRRFGHLCEKDDAVLKHKFRASDPLKDFPAFWPRTDSYRFW
jgi:hypothetical protein